MSFFFFADILSFVIPGHGPGDRIDARINFALGPRTRNTAAIRASNVFYVYLLASRKQGTLYLGVTRDLVRRIYQHREKLTPGFTSRYDVRRLVWFEVYDDPVNATQREKEIKKWRRSWKIALIEKENPDWRDLYPEITK
jgi:putative endonuclease